MKIKIQAELTGQELVETFVNQLKSNQIDPNLTKIKFLVTNSQGKEVELGADKIRLSYSNE